MTTCTIGTLTLSAIAVRPSSPPRGILIALHGGGYRAGYWHYPPHSLLDAAAARGHLALAIDRPGYGAAHDSPMPLAQQAEVVLDLAEQLRDREGPLPVWLVGHSMGGILALTIAALPRAHGLIAGVEAGGVPLRMAEILPGDAGRRGNPATDTHMPPASAELVRTMFFGPDDTFDAAAFAYGMTLASPIPFAELPDAFNAGRDLPAMMQRTTLPVRLSFAEHEASSVVTPDLAEAARAALAQSRGAVVRYEPATGHNFSLHHAGTAYHQGILAWIEGLAG